MKGITDWYIRIGEWGLNLFFLNILWVLFSVLGLFVVGIFPATVALFAVMRKLIMDSEDTPIFKSFWQTFKSEFLRSNLLGYILLSVGCILYIDFRVLQQLDGNFLNYILTMITFILIFVYFLIVFYIFPIFVHLNLKILEYIKYAFIMIIGRPLQTILLMIILAVILFLFIQIPGLIPVMGMSLISLCVMKITSRSLFLRE